MAVNPFVLEKEAYQRDINILDQYVQDVASFLHIQTQQPHAVCVGYVKKQLSATGKFPFKDPNVRYLQREENGDRIEKQTTLWKYIKDSIDRKELIAPTFTTYVNQLVNQSVLVDFIDENIALRSKAKKEMFVAEMAGNKLLAILKKNEQANKKISNNSMSGAHVSNSTPLFNRTSHSTLTSNCRCTSGYGNANNEKLLTGNRHYWNPKIVLNNIVSIINNTDYSVIQAVKDKYQLHTPTTEEVMTCITYSTNLYWRNKKSLALIESFVARLTDLQKIAFVYTGDLYHLAQYNDAVIRDFLTSLSAPIVGDCPNPKEIIDSHSEDYLVLATQFFPDLMRGKTVKDVQNEKIYEYLALTVQHIYGTLDRYRDLIACFFVTKNVPASLAFLPESIRRAALTSDTDSTIFTVQDWVFWMYGKEVGFTNQTQAISATMIFLAAQSITHILARMSANFGIQTKRIHQVAMKNEFKFDVFIPTQIGKHYFAYISCQEGSIYKQYKKEIKGVHLKSSNVPKIIMKQAEDLMTRIMDTIVAGKKIVLTEILKHVGDIEREIQRSVLAGESTYFRTMQIKGPQSYTKDETSSPYQYYTFWQEVFAPTYGDCPAPPYTGLKIPVKLQNRTMMVEWIASIQNQELSQRFKGWMERTCKTSAEILILPEQILETAGLPTEIKEIIDLRKITYDISQVFYIILETLNFYCVNRNITRLISDEY